MEHFDYYSPLINKATDTQSRMKVKSFFSQWDVFSQWHPSCFTDPKDGREYLSGEHYMMTQKAITFGCSNSLESLDLVRQTKLFRVFSSGNITIEKILSHGSCSEFATDQAIRHLIGNRIDTIQSLAKLWAALQRVIKSLGKKVKGFIEEKWDEAKECIVFNGNYLKYSQNAEMKSSLMATKGMILVEAALNDAIWGAGIGKNDPKLSTPHLWCGSNLLGKALTNLRGYFSI